MEEQFKISPWLVMWNFLFSTCFSQKQKHLINIFCTHRNGWNNMGNILPCKFIVSKARWTWKISTITVHKSNVKITANIMVDSLCGYITYSNYLGTKILPKRIFSPIQSTRRGYHLRKAVLHFLINWNKIWQWNFCLKG